MSTLKWPFATAIGIKEDLCKTDNTKLSDLMVQIKDKVPSFDYRTKIQILILKPEILLQTFVGVSEYLVLRAREIKIQSGIFAIPERK